MGVGVGVYYGGWQGADLHSFLESLRTPGRSGSQDVRSLVRTTNATNDDAALPAYLTQHPSLFAFRFSPQEDAGSPAQQPHRRAHAEHHAASAAEKESAGEEVSGGEEGEGGGRWSKCVQVRAVEAVDHSSLRVLLCQAPGLPS